MIPFKKVAELSDKLNHFEHNFKSTVQKITEFPNECGEREKLLEALSIETAVITTEIASVLFDCILKTSLDHPFKTTDCYDE